MHSKKNFINLQTYTIQKNLISTNQKIQLNQIQFKNLIFLQNIQSTKSSNQPINQSINQLLYNLIFLFKLQSTMSY